MGLVPVSDENVFTLTKNVEKSKPLQFIWLFHVI